MPYGPPTPASDCSFPCPGDSSESCGAGNRMVVYTDTAGTPPSPSTCITWRDGFSWGNGILEAVDKTNTGGGKTRLYAIPTNPFTDPIYYTIISVSAFLLTSCHRWYRWLMCESACDRPAPPDALTLITTTSVSWMVF